MYSKLSAARAYVYAVARACDAGEVSRRVSVNSFYISRNEIEQKDSYGYLTLLAHCAGLCRSYFVRLRPSSRGNNRGNAMPRRQWVHQR